MSPIKNRFFFLPAILLFILFSTAAFAVDSVRSVDFNNFSYQPECVQSLVDSGLPKTIKVKQGKFETKPGMGAAYFNVNQVVYADLDKDGREEAVVCTECSFRGANYWKMEYFIYTIKDGRPVLITSLNNKRIKTDYKSFFPDSSPWNFDQADIIEGKLVVTLHADGPHCCPEYEVKITYELDGGKLKLVGKPVRKKISS